MHLNYEFKAKTDRLKELEKLLSTRNPVFCGEDHQTDTYFNVKHGRLKLREGNIENALIHYQRSDLAGAKQSDVILYQHKPDKDLRQALTAALGIKVVVEKSRKIYFVDNVKIHFDKVTALGSFVEVEAIDKDGLRKIETLQQQCKDFAGLFGIRESDYVAESYSDLFLRSDAS
jgi:adenylate cyclase, class 2